MKKRSRISSGRAVQRDNVGPAPVAGRILFAAAVFVAATLTFSIQPLLAKMMLPRLGGGPAVWNACMLFFQAGGLRLCPLAAALDGFSRSRRRPSGIGRLGGRSVALCR